MADPVTRLNAALEGRYAIERALVEIGWRSVVAAWQASTWRCDGAVPTVL